MAIWLGRIHRVKALHAEAQRSWLWELDFGSKSGEGFTPIDLEKLKFLAVELSYPGFECTVEPYFIAGNEHYQVGGIRRGGSVIASFIEVDYGFVEDFFRGWLDKFVDVPDLKKLISTKRYPKNYSTRRVEVRMLNRSGITVRKFTLHNLLPMKVGRHRFTYDRSGVQILPVEMYCDFVETSMQGVKGRIGS